MIAIVLALAAGAQDKVDIRPELDIPIIAAGVTGLALPELFKEQLAPSACRICETPSPNGVDAFFHDQLTGWIFDRKTSDTISNAWVYAVLPVSGLTASYLATGPYASEGAGWRAVVIVVESVAVSGALVQAVKLTAARTRPFVAYGHVDPGGSYADGSDGHLSLPSGHTAFAASLGVSVAMTAQLQESPAAPWLWAAAGVATVSTAGLRMMAEKHWFTDALGGAAIGAACGVVFPLLHKRGNALSVAARGPSIALSGRF